MADNAPTARPVDSLRAAVLGCAVGDAYGLPYEFCRPGSFSLYDTMRAGGVWGQPAGTWSDDTSGALCTLASFADAGCLDATLIRDRLRLWAKRGWYACDGEAFDVGATTMRAIDEDAPQRGERDLGCGGLLRAGVAGLLCADEVALSDPEQVKACLNAAGARGAEASLATHGDGMALDCARAVARAACGLALGMNCNHARYTVSWAHRGMSAAGRCDEVLASALMCVSQADDFMQCINMSVVLGGDTDTRGAIAGMLAGIRFGADAIPRQLMAQLRGKRMLDDAVDKVLEKVAAEHVSE